MYTHFALNDGQQELAMSGLTNVRSLQVLSLFQRRALRLLLAFPCSILLNSGTSCAVFVGYGASQRNRWFNLAVVLRYFFV